jgi:hypothetical protein
MVEYVTPIVPFFNPGGVNQRNIGTAVAEWQRAALESAKLILQKVKKTRPRGPGLSLSDRECFAAILVFGDDWRRGRPEVVV